MNYKYIAPRRHHIAYICTRRSLYCTSQPILQPWTENPSSCTHHVDIKHASGLL